MFQIKIALSGNCRHFEETWMFGLKLQSLSDIIVLSISVMLIYTASWGVVSLLVKRSYIYGKTMPL